MHQAKQAQTKKTKAQRQPQPSPHHPHCAIFVSLCINRIINLVFKNRIFFFLIQLPAFLLAQKSDTSLMVFKLAELELMEQQKAAFYSHSEAERSEANKKIIGIWDRIVDNPRIMDYSFDALKNDYSILMPPDKKFKLITWNIYKNDGTYAFFGYLLVNNSKRIKKGFFKYETLQAYETFKLIDRSVTVKSPETYIGAPDKWFGMLYYSVITCDGFYTLIGYDANDKMTQRKFIDVLYFKPDGSPVFGKDVFKFPRKNPRRLMFEYSSSITMSIKYNEKRGQIIYSHLAPNTEGELLQGQYQYYGPDGSYDALELRKDKWVTIEDVDARGDKKDTDEDWNNPQKPSRKKSKKLMPGTKSGK